MKRSAFAVAGCLASLLTMSGTALAEPPCSGITIAAVVETAPGKLTSVGERCYERGPGVPFYYDAPGKRPSMEVEVPHHTSASPAEFDAITIEALGAQDVSDWINPFPAGQGRADFRPE